MEWVEEGDRSLMQQKSFCQNKREDLLNCSEASHVVRHGNNTTNEKTGRRGGGTENVAIFFGRDEAAWTKSRTITSEAQHVIVGSETKLERED